MFSFTYEISLTYVRSTQTPSRGSVLNVLNRTNGSVNLVPVLKN